MLLFFLQMPGFSGSGKPTLAREVYFLLLSATKRPLLLMSKPFDLLRAMLISTIIREECSKTSSATNWPLLHLSKPFNLIPTSLAPTITRDVYSNILEEEEKLSKPTIEQSNLAIDDSRQEGTSIIKILDE